MGDRVRGACFDAVTAEYAARIVDIVNAGVAFSGGDPIGIGIFGSLDVDAIRRTSRGAEKASNTFLEPGLIAVQNMNPTVARLEMYRLEGIVLGDRFTKHIAESHAESLHQRGKGFTDFS